MSDISRLSGVGPKRLKILAGAGIQTLRDLVYHIPRRYIDRTCFSLISDLETGKDAIFTAKVVSMSIVATRMIIEVEDSSGSVELVFFNGVQFLRSRFFEGQKLLVAGVPTFFRDLQMVHPEFESLKDGEEPKGEILSRYPLTEEMAASRIEHRFLQKVALEALDLFSFSDAIAENVRSSLRLLPEADLLRALHKLNSIAELSELRRQLKVRELVPLSLRMEGQKLERLKVGRVWPRSTTMQKKLVESLPFALTDGQVEAVKDISICQSEARQFCGLLMGDVGSGKTVVALLTASNVLEAGGQVALMAPTEILAAQHFQTLSPWLTQVGIHVALLTGDTPKSEREILLQDLESGALQFLVGTHALYSGDVQFQKLGLAIVDEQHRFGVQQRLALAAKGGHPDILYMSATPIPRTLAQTVFGDLENFILKEKPAGRLPVKTRLVPPEKRGDMLGFLLKESMGGNQVFWVVPQIGDKEKIKSPQEDLDIFVPEGKRPEEDIATVDRLRVELAQYSKEWKVGIVHGKLAAEKKEAALAAFRGGELQVLLATTVIEVGVDVPQANLMVIESPDRFGLAQLHQLRGRTGRGMAQAWCFLTIPDRVWPLETYDRLAGFTETTDGFKIAEMDLKARGTGSLEGNDQSGYGGLRFTDLLEDFELTQEIRRFAKSEVARNPSKVLYFPPDA